mgnify:CR=1 FL=1
MSKPNKITFWKSLKTSMAKHSPEILTGVGIAGMATTVILAVRATPKALELIDEKKKELKVEKLTPIETVKVAWKPYVSTAVTGIAATTCLIKANSISTRRNAALVTAYKLSETALDEYRNKVVETIGEKKEKAIRDDIDKDRVNNKPVNQATVITAKKGHTLCMDGYNHRYFESDIDEIDRAVTRLNASLVRDGEVCLNDFYDEIGLDHCEVGYQVGWNANRVGRDLIELNTSAQIASDGRACIVVNLTPRPEWNYTRY